MSQAQKNKSMIIGGHGQDGRWLNKMLLEQDVEVTLAGHSDIALRDPSSVASILRSVQPDTIYYLAAHQYASQSSPAIADSEVLEQSILVHVQGCANVLEAIAAINPACRFFYACSSRVFGQPGTGMQDENTPLAPVCIYGITKAAGLECCRYYRRHRNLLVSCGILYSHESSLGKPTFIIRKIVTSAVKIAKGSNELIRIGNLSARADWGFAPDYVKAIHLIMEARIADDFIIASGETHAVQEVVELVFEALGLEWRRYVVEDPSLISRQAPALCGNPQKLRDLTGWLPSLTFQQMVLEILNSSLNE